MELRILSVIEVHHNPRQPEEQQSLERTVEQHILGELEEQRRSERFVERHSPRQPEEQCSPV